MGMDFDMSHNIQIISFIAMASTQVSLKNYSDQDLVAMFIASSNAVFFKELYERYQRKVFGRCLTMLQDEELAADARQEVFIRIFMKLPSFNQQSTFSTWLYTVTYNYCVDIIRRQKCRPVVQSDLPLANHPTDESNSDVESRWAQTYGRVERALFRVAEEERTILQMKYLDGLSIREMADFLKKSESAVKMKIHRAKQKVLLVADFATVE